MCLIKDIPSKLQAAPLEGNPLEAGRKAEAVVPSANQTSLESEGPRGKERSDFFLTCVYHLGPCRPCPVPSTVVNGRLLLPNFRVSQDNFLGPTLWRPSWNQARSCAPGFQTCSVFVTPITPASHKALERSKRVFSPSCFHPWVHHFPPKMQLVLVGAVMCCYVPVLTYL